MQTARGMSLIDVILGIALMLVIFLALFGILQASLKVSQMIKAESTATAIANNQLEYIRSLPYNSVGTVGGIPAGSIPQNATTTEDGALYGVRTLVEYYDDPADGLGVNDANGITADYKKIKVVVTYSVGTGEKQIVVNSIYAPPGIETTVGGGTLQIIVVNAAGAPVPGATVQIINASTTPTVDLTTFTDVTGTVYLPGAATSTQYQVVVSKSGYSTAQTYARDDTNQNPNPGYLTVAENLTTTSTFAIDQLSTLNLQTFSTAPSGEFNDSFVDDSKLATLTNTVSSAGALTLSGGMGTYALSGSADSIGVSPQDLDTWGQLTATLSTPSGTTALVHVLDATTGNPIPDAVLPGNSTGFSTFPVHLSGISTTTYPSLALSADVHTSSETATPSITAWGIAYQNVATPIPDVHFTLTGSKTIGTTDDGAPVYKNAVSGTTDDTGTDSLPLEWDSYSLAVPEYDVDDACPSAPPFVLSPGAALTESLILGSHTSNSLLVSVTNASGNPISGATVTLSDRGYSKTVISSACGGAYFGNVPPTNDYVVTVSASGYTASTATGVAVSGQTFYEVSF